MRAHMSITNVYNPWAPTQVHRDLSLRNVLLFTFDDDVTKTLVKVCNFGLTVRSYGLYTYGLVKVCDFFLTVSSHGLDSYDLVKVCDFGLTVSTYGATHRTIQSSAMPVRYMPPEALRRSRYSEKSDVWAYGVTAFELLSAGEHV